jgi:hypothetical protein
MRIKQEILKMVEYNSLTEIIVESDCNDVIMKMFGITDKNLTTDEITQISQIRDFSPNATELVTKLRSEGFVVEEEIWLCPMA